MQPFLWDRACARPQATVPEGRRATSSPPIRSCSGRGLPSPLVTQRLVSSYLTFSPLPGTHRWNGIPSSIVMAVSLLKWYPTRRVSAGRFVSVALSLGSHPLEFLQRRALWSPDFPPFHVETAAAQDTLFRMGIIAPIQKG